MGQYDDASRLRPINLVVRHAVRERDELSRRRTARRIIERALFGIAESVIGGRPQNDERKNKGDESLHAAGYGKEGTGSEQIIRAVQRFPVPSSLFPRVSTCYFLPPMPADAQ